MQHQLFKDGLAWHERLYAWLDLNKPLTVPLLVATPVLMYLGWSYLGTRHADDTMLAALPACERAKLLKYDFSRPYTIDEVREVTSYCDAQRDAAPLAAKAQQQRELLARGAQQDKP